MSRLRFRDRTRPAPIAKAETSGIQTTAYKDWRGFFHVLSGRKVVFRFKRVAYSTTHMAICLQR